MVSGQPMRVVIDQHCLDGTKVIVSNMPGGLQWQELKDYFTQAGQVHYANIGRQEVRGFGVAQVGNLNVGEVRFHNRDDAAMATSVLHGQPFKGTSLTVKPDLSSKEQTKVLVFNIPIGTDWTELKEHFSAVGQVAFVGIDCKLKGKGKGCAQAAESGKGFSQAITPVQALPAGGGCVANFGCGFGAYGGGCGCGGGCGGCGSGGFCAGGCFGAGGCCGGCGGCFPAGCGGCGCGFGACGAQYCAMSPDAGLIAASQMDLAEQMGVVGVGGAKGSGKSVRASGDPREEGEVRFHTPELAQRAAQVLDKSLLMGQPINVSMDPHSLDGTKVVITNMPAGCHWSDVREHFSQIGPIHYANIGRTVDHGHGKGFGSAKPGNLNVGEVRFGTSEEAKMACQVFHGQIFKGQALSVKPDLTCKEETRLLVFNIPIGTDWTELRAFFSSAGEIAFCGIDCKTSGKGKGGKGGSGGSMGGGGGGGCVGPQAYDGAASHAFNGVAPAGVYVGGMGGMGGMMVPAHMAGMGSMGGMVMMVPADQVGYFGGGQRMGPPRRPIVRSSGDPSEEAEVRFFSSDSAKHAVQTFNGAILNGMQIHVAIDPACPERVLVTNMPAGVSWQELKDHFSQVGEVQFSNIGKHRGMHGGSHGRGGFDGQDSGQPFVGEINYNSPSQAQAAMHMLDGTEMRGVRISVQMDPIHPSKILVHNLPPGCKWQEVKNHFSQAGHVPFTAVRRGGFDSTGQHFQHGYGPGGAFEG
eukprot:TRINITY_DN7279_c0_g1_i1.p1 TRINITY_DN7279_c0_g1~~TRINITY_DN7279_c0_g1_i1.p1  ORF type:complete len:859 (+),score=135.60 TRINITY_DN7279_c0_g1_i1:328-2577(+)